MVSLFSGLWFALFPHNHSQWRHFRKVENESRRVLASMIMRCANTERKPPGLRQPRRSGKPSRRTVVMVEKKKAGQILRTGKKWKKSNKEPNTRNITWKSPLQETCGPLAGLPWAQPCLLGLPSLLGHLSCARPPCHLPSPECERKGPVILLLRQRNYRERDIWLT